MEVFIVSSAIHYEGYEAPYGVYDNIVDAVNAADALRDNLDSRLYHSCSVWKMNVGKTGNECVYISIVKGN